MNKAFLIGNLTRDPELRTTQSGVSVCSFTIAVNRRRSNNAEAGQPEADFFRITAWRQLGEICARYLAKGRKVSVIGPVSVSTYTTQDGQTRAQMEVTAEDVEFLTPKGEGEQIDPGVQAVSARQIMQTIGQQAQQAQQQAPAIPSGYVQVDEEELPF